MKILYDYQIFQMQSFGGISRYFGELIRAFQNDHLEAHLALKYSDNIFLKNYPHLVKTIVPIPSYERFMPGVSFKGKWRLYALLKKLKLIKDALTVNKALALKALKRGRFDIFHPTYYDPYFLDEIGTTPFILTVHDMIHELYSKRYAVLNDKTIANKKRLLEKCSHIIAISENTKKDIMSLYGVEKEKITVIYHGASFDPHTYKNTYLNKERPPERYILYVGHRAQYKNFEFFIKAMASLLKKDKNLYVICAGGNPFSQSELEKLKRLTIEKQVLHQNITDQYLAYLYSKALLFVFPSLYEGFGIPILEAFACQCPVVLSHSSSFPEVAGSAGVYFDPKDENSIREAIMRVLQDKALRQNLKQRGTERLKHFSWQKTAAQTKKVYERILNRSLKLL